MNSAQGLKQMPNFTGGSVGELERQQKERGSIFLVLKNEDIEKLNALNGQQDRDGANS